MGSIVHVDFIQNLPVSGDMLQPYVAVDSVSVPDDVTSSSTVGGVVEGRQSEEEQTSRTHGAPHLSHRLGVTVRS